MTAPPTGRTDATWIFNHLRYGQTYRASTRHGIAIGEYLGMETPHGDWALLLRHSNGTESIPLPDVTSIRATMSHDDSEQLRWDHTVCA